MHAWVKRLESLTKFMTNAESQVITFVIGAGASLSTGTPTTRQVVDALREYGYFKDEESLRSAIHELAGPVKRAAIARLFPNPLVPHLGYRALAALAYRVRLLVLNLNWDNAVQRACDAVGVACVSVDIADLTAVEAALRDPDTRVVCVHLHGMLPGSGELRFGTLETLQFEDPGVNELLLKEFFTHPTVIVGTRLHGDTDMLKLLQRIESRSAHNSPPVWLLTCEQDVSESRPLRRMMTARGSEQNIIFDEALDFDRALVWINAELSGFTFEKFRVMHPRAGLPSYMELVFPRPDILRPALDARTAVLLGEPCLGKSTIAHFLAFFHHSLKPSLANISKDGEDGRPRIATGARCADILANATPDTIIVLEDPFGSTSRSETNGAVANALRSGRRRTRSGRTIVTSRQSSWDVAMQSADAEHHQRRLFRETTETLRIVSDAEPWYSADDLMLLIPPKQAHLRQRIGPSDLNTPARVTDAVRGNGASRPGEIVAEKAQLLKQLDAPYRRTVALLRLQLLSSYPRTWSRILQDAGITANPSAAERIASFSHTFTLDGNEYARLRHPTDIEAVDRLLSESDSALLRELHDIAPHIQWVDNALRVRAAIANIEKNRITEGLSLVTPEERADWAPQFLSVANNPEILAHLDHGMDLWSLRDYVYELVRLWDDLRRNATARSTVATLLSDRKRQGIYAVLEAALFLQQLTHPEIWVKVEHELWRLYESPADNRENLALAFDAIFWRDAPDDRIRSKEWVDRLLCNTPRNDPLRGAFAFSLVFHANAALRYLGEKIATTQTVEVLRSLNDEQEEMFCWMLRWHFIHECRDRALVQRRQLPDELMGYLRRSLFDQIPAEHEREILLAACEQLKRLRPGAAFLLALNVAAVRGRFEMNDVLNELLAVAPPADPYVILAAMTYTIPPEVLKQAQEYFRDDRNRTMLLEAFADGLKVDGIRVERPRFDACRDAFTVMDALAISWPNLDRLQVPLSSRAGFKGYLKAWQKNVTASPSAFRALVKRTGRGDLRPLEAGATHARTIPDVISAAIMSMTPQSGTYSPRTTAALADQLAAGTDEASTITAILALTPTPELIPRRAEALRRRAHALLATDVTAAVAHFRDARTSFQLLGTDLSAEEKRQYANALVKAMFKHELPEKHARRLRRKRLEILERAYDILDKPEKLHPLADAARTKEAESVDAAILQAEQELTRSTDVPAPPRPAVSVTERPKERIPIAKQLCQYEKSGTIDAAIEKLATFYLAGDQALPTNLEMLFPRLRIKAVQVAQSRRAGELRRDGGGYRIIVNANATPERARYTIAHELAHAILAAELPQVPTRLCDNKRLESACDALAAALLMPTRAFRQALGEPPTLRALKATAQAYGVSLQAAAIRAEELTRCVTFRISDGKREWQTKGVDASHPSLKDVVRELLRGNRWDEPVIMTTKHHTGAWHVEYDIDEADCTVFLRPQSLTELMELRRLVRRSAM